MSRTSRASEKSEGGAFFFWSKGNTVTPESAPERNASAWRAKAAPPANPQNVIDLELPSGFVVKATRPPLEMWLLGNAIPLDLMDKALNAVRMAAGDHEEQNRMISESFLGNPAEAYKGLTFMRDAVQYAVVYPRIKLDADPNSPDEISPSQIPLEDFTYIVSWVMRGCPGIAVKLDSGGETSVEAVESFRPKSRVRGARKAGRKTRTAGKRKTKTS
jgi:hypothetical protein